jgi:HSP20 family protein
MTKNDVTITYVDNVITLRGKLDSCEEGKQMTQIRQERSKGSFEKTIRLPAKIVAEKIDASFTNGLLTITLPKAEDAKPKTITIGVK